MIPRTGPALVLPTLALVSSALVLLGLLDSSYIRAGAVFEYPLSSVYTHLALAEHLFTGQFGTNVEDVVVPVSSVVFPVLVFPLFGEEFHRFMPLIWNGIGLALSAILWGRILWLAGYGVSVLGMALAAVGPVTLNIAGVAFTGLEHSLHVAASLAIVAGLLTIALERKLSWLLVSGVFFAPLLRPEGLVLAVLAGGAVLVRGQIKLALLLAALACGPAIAVAFWLIDAGLDPVPRAVFPDGLSFDSIGSHLQERLTDALTEPRVALLSVLAAIAFLLLIPVIRAKGPVVMLVTVSVAAVAHVCLGRFDGMDQYEIYAVAGLSAGLLAATAQQRWYLRLVPVFLVAAAGLVYVPNHINRYPNTPRVIHLQDAQISRFAKDHLREPVAVTDPGYVAWQNPNFVLNLLNTADPAVAVRRHNIRMAMIDDDEVMASLPEDWQRLGTLHATETPVPSGVAFYLTGPDDPIDVLELLQAWIVDLPEDAIFELDTGEL